jgi:hypothetical protein
MATPEDGKLEGTGTGSQRPSRTGPRFPPKVTKRLYSIQEAARSDNTEAFDEPLVSLCFSSTSGSCNLDGGGARCDMGTH